LVEHALDFRVGQVRTAEAHIVGERTIDEVEFSDEGDVSAEVGEVPGSDVDTLDADMAFGGAAEGVDQVEEGAGAAADGTGDGDAIAGENGEVQMFEERACAGVSEGEVFEFKGARGLSYGGLDAFLVFDGQVDDAAEFVDGSERIVPIFEVFSETDDGGDNGADDQFTGDELAEGEAALEHEQTAEGEEQGAGDGFETEEAEDLSEQDSEVGSSGGDVGINELVGAFLAERGGGGVLEQEGEHDDLFEPTGDGVFGVGFVDAGADTVAAEGKEDEDETDHEDEVECEEEGVVEGEDEQADGHGKDDIDAVEEDVGGTLLDGDDVEEFVDQFGAAGAFEGAVLEAWEAAGEIGGETHEDALLDEFNDEVLHGADGAESEEEEEEDAAEDEQGLDINRLLTAETDVVDDGIHGERAGEVKEARDDGKENDETDIGSLRFQESEEASVWGNMVGSVGHSWSRVGVSPGRSTWGVGISRWFSARLRSR